jgi:hypothetical protein
VGALRRGGTCVAFRSFEGIFGLIGVLHGSEQLRNLEI